MEGQEPSGDRARTGTWATQEQRTLCDRVTTSIPQGGVSVHFHIPGLVHNLSGLGTPARAGPCGHRGVRPASGSCWSHGAARRGRGAAAGAQSHRWCPQSHRGVPSPATAAPPIPKDGKGSSRAPAMGWGDKIGPAPAPATGATGLAGSKWSRGVAVAETCSKLCVKLLACPSLLPLWKELLLGMCQPGVLRPGRGLRDTPAVLGFSLGHLGAAVPRSLGLWECAAGASGALGRSGRGSARRSWLCPLCPRLAGSVARVIFGGGLALSQAAAAPVTFPELPSPSGDRDTTRGRQVQAEQEGAQGAAAERAGMFPGDPEGRGGRGEDHAGPG
ncbi:protein S100-A1 isoform X2 [Poecile atricapillus]|uniref:protein S100-A1 isoform X2 n=1 Tax=Poecile atricapillus TaxID=48891 RepID=UPI002739EB2B|nr:protein S100-A1 isoform X2 [Poecile atricapillus]